MHKCIWYIKLRIRTVWQYDRGGNLPLWNRILSIRCVFKNRTALGMIQSIYYYNPYLKPSQYLLYVTSNGELYSWYMFVLLSQPRSNQPSNHSAYSFAVTQPHAPISRQYILTAMETENSAECTGARKDEHVAEGGLLITYGHYVIVAAWQAQRNVCKSIHILSAIPKWRQSGWWWCWWGQRTCCLHQFAYASDRAHLQPTHIICMQP